MERRERSSREQWRKRVERWRDSGLTAAEFSAEVGINPRTLAFWKWKLSKEDAGESTKPRSRRAPRSRSTALQPARFDAVTFVEFAPAEDRTVPIELVIGRYVVRVPGSFDADVLGRVLDVVERCTA